MEINNRTVRLLERPVGLPTKDIWSFKEENLGDEAIGDNDEADFANMEDDGD